MEVASKELASASQQLLECPTDLLGMIFSYVPWGKPSDYSDTEKADFNRVASFYLALKEKEKSSENPDAFLLNCINRNMTLCLDTLLCKDFYGFIEKNGDEIKTLNLSGETLPKDLIETLKEKCPNLRNLEIYSENFNQPLEELQTLTGLIIWSKAFDKPLDGLGNTKITLVNEAYKP